MKPLRLEIAAFGPYGGTEIIDFARLEGHKLFLICGPTGAGKTSILDALTWALYGESSGVGRDAGHFRSHHAEPSTPTEAQLDFAVGQDRYRVWRRAGWQRPKKRGDGFTEERPVAELQKYNGDTLESVADKLSDVLHEVQALMGMSASEFRQIILLPQGEFRRLLAAKPSEREAILQTLFQTSMYGRIADVLKKAAKGAKKELEALHKRREGVLEGTQTESEDAIEVAVASERDTIDQSAREVEANSAAARSTREAVEAARRTQARLDEQQAAVLALEQLLLRAEQSAAQKQTLARAREAGAIAPVVSRYEELERRQREAERELAVAERELETWRSRSTSANAEREAAEKTEPERAALEARARELDGLRPARDRLHELHAELEAARAASTEAAAELEDLKTRLETFEAKHQATEETHVAARERSAEHERLRHEHTKLEESVERAEKHAHWHGRLRSHSEALTEARDRVATAQSELEVARADVGTLEQDWLGGQAAVLAGGLTAGEPCPVCGSTEHPDPAEHGEAPEQERLEAARAASARAEEELQRHRSAETHLHGEVEATRARAEALAAELGGEIDVDAWRARLAETRVALDAAEEARAEADRLAAELTALHTDIRSHRGAVEQATSRHASTESKHAAAAVRVEESEARVPEPLRAGDALERELTIARDRAAELGTQLAQARERAEVAARELAGATASCERAERRLHGDREATDEARARLDEALRDAGFANRDAWRAATLTAEQIDALETELREVGESVAAARDRATRARKEADGLEPPDLVRLESAADDADRSLADAHKRHATSVTRLEQLEHARATLRTIAGDARDQELRWQLIADLANVASGKNARKLSFQRFVLAGLFDDVLYAASEQLKVMSRGRYLLRQDDSFKKGGQQGGLNLVVDDAYTGTDRPVSTLSGGEGFLAALSLALGLSDVVQSYSGGTYLDALFIDEGFGSLDPEALDLAIRALTDLESGGRLVGVISHVPELRERIPARLEVEPGPAGSRTHFETNG